MKRVLCVWFPNWPIQRLRHARPELRKPPLVLYAPGGRGQMVVTACSVSAAQQGIVPGMPLAEAKALVACQESGVRGQGSAAHFEPHDRRADREALRKLAVWCQRFSPLVAVEEADEPAALLLDITGCAPFFRGETPLAAKLASAFQRGGYRVETAIADTIGVAWAIAHCGDPANPATPVSDDLLASGGRQPSDDSLLAATNGKSSGSLRPPLAVIIPPGEQAAALRSLPVAALRLPAPVLQRLFEFDIRRIDQLLALPRADRNRLDPEVVRRFDQAMGDIPEVIDPEPAEEPVGASWSFEPPTTDRRLMEAVLERLLEQVLARLRPRNRGVQRLLCSLWTTAGEPVHVPVGLLQPSLSTSHLMQLIRLHWERLSSPSLSSLPLAVKGRRGGDGGGIAVSTITVQASAVAPLEAQQEQLFAVDAEAEQWQEFPTLIERLSNRLGEQAVLRPRLWPDHQPEFACRYAPWLTDQIRNAKSKIRKAKRNPWESRASNLVRVADFKSRISPLLRPPCLTAQPIAIPVMSVVPGGPPLRFQWKNRTHIVAHYWGPERIETGWWREQGVRRDYYLVETAAGKRFWLFRRREDEMWFLHGLFA